RAFHPKARSHSPITVPDAVEVKISAASGAHQFVPSTTQATFEFPHHRDISPDPIDAPECFGNEPFI
ncbi:MAG: hypothetical protein KKI03_07715, partial [Gammaproteobacteria bacterium]|nr:hypothetical protein [Gammaproteobacteria bacterium]